MSGKKWEESEIEYLRENVDSKTCEQMATELGRSTSSVKYQVSKLNIKSERPDLVERNTKHGGCHTRLYRVWKSMKNRCKYPSNPSFKNYGARGITVCAEWDNFITFSDWAMSNGYNDTLSIDRIDVNGNYEPSNCRFSDIITQSENKRNSVNLEITAFGETKSAIRWSYDERCVVNLSALNTRLALGWEPERAITEPSGYAKSEESKNAMKDSALVEIAERTERTEFCEKETIETYGPISYSKHSKSKVIYICDYCGTKSTKAYGKLINGRSVVPKNCCNNTECMKKKRSESFLKKYGIASPGSLCIGKVESEEHKNARMSKIQSSVRAKYGVDNVFQLDETKRKARETSLNKYGVEHPSKNEEVVKKQQNTMMERYGVSSPLQLEENREKAKETTKSRFGSEFYAQTEAFREECKARRKTFDGLTLNDLVEITGKTLSTVSDQLNKFGIEYVLSNDIKMTGIEYKFSEWLKSENIDYTFNRKLSNYRCDFLIGNLAVELNGLYWHSDSFLDDKFYHFNKRIEYIKNGFRPVFFMEDEILNKFDIVISIIKNKLGKSSKIGARKCDIKEVDKNIGYQFLNDNHLMSSGSGSIVGLYHNNILVCVLQFVVKENHIDISRFCNTLNHSVVGGFSRLLSYLRSKYPDKHIVNFIDLRYGDGKHLSDIGFVSNEPHLSFMWTNYKQRFHRMKYPNNTGYDNNMHKIWDCGQQKFTLEHK